MGGTVVTKGFYVDQNIFLRHRKPQQNTSKWNLTTYKKDYISGQSGVYSGNASFNIWKSINEYAMLIE